MAEKLTPWIDGSIAPVRPGIYERRMPDEDRPVDCPMCYGGFAFFDGKHWFPAWGTAAAASAEQIGRSGFQCDNASVWRGLAEEPTHG